MSWVFEEGRLACTKSKVRRVCEGLLQRKHLLEFLQVSLAHITCHVMHKPAGGDSPREKSVTACVRAKLE